MEDADKLRREDWQNRASAAVRRSSVEQYTRGIARMLDIRNRCTAEVRDYLDPIVLKQTIELADGLEGIAISTLAKLPYIAGQDDPDRPPTSGDQR